MLPLCSITGSTFSDSVASVWTLSAELFSNISGTNVIEFRPRVNVQDLNKYTRNESAILHLTAIQNAIPYRSVHCCPDTPALFH